MRTTFLVDGFNVYHSLLGATRNSPKPKGVRWLDLRSLLSSYLSAFGHGATLHEVRYFSALAFHRDSFRPGGTARHQAYIEALQHTGVKVELGRFKYKSVWCEQCRQKTPAREEKETDVAIACALLEIFQSGECDAAVLVSGDTDLAPAVRTAQRIFPAKPVHFLFPNRRHNQELEKLVSGRSVKIKAKAYAKHQFPDPLTLDGGRTIRKPSEW